MPRKTNPIDEFLNSDQLNEMSVLNPMPGGGVGKNIDQVAQQPKEASQKMSMDDETERLGLGGNFLGEAAEAAAKLEGGSDSADHEGQKIKTRP